MIRGSYVLLNAGRHLKSRKSRSFSGTLKNGELTREELLTGYFSLVYSSLGVIERPAGISGLTGELSKK